MLSGVRWVCVVCHSDKRQVGGGFEMQAHEIPSQFSVDTKIAGDNAPRTSPLDERLFGREGDGCVHDSHLWRRTGLHRWAW